ncbi:hypothetical protein C0J52_15763 [Blattella germanica]|nr:hypothetical protein C0J52_15763 [Blattella germanica]
MCEMMINADIPLYKVNNPHFTTFIDKYTCKMVVHFIASNNNNKEILFKCFAFDLYLPVRKDQYKSCITIRNKLVPLPSNSLCLVYRISHPTKVLSLLIIVSDRLRFFYFNTPLSFHVYHNVIMENRYHCLRFLVTIEIGPACCTTISPLFSFLSFITLGMSFLFSRSVPAQSVLFSLKI